MKQNDETNISLIEKLFNLGAHLGHKSSKTHPRAKKFIFQFQNGEAIIDLEKTANQINQVKKFLAEAAKNKKSLLVVGTKHQAREIIKNICSNIPVNYINKKWIGGFITNFEEIQKNLKKLELMTAEKEKGSWKNLPKHEQLKLEKKLKKLTNLYEGIREMKALPDIIFVIDTHKEKGVIDEAKKRKITTIGLVDTNANPDLVDYPIMANDDLPPVIEFITKELVYSYQQNLKK